MSSRLMLSVATAVLFAGAATAATLTVPSATYPTLQSALNAVAQGDVIEIKAGSYTQAITLDFVIGVTVRGKGKVVIQADALTSGINLTQCADITIENIEVRSAADVGVNLSDCGKVTLKKVRSTGAQNSGFRSISCFGLWLTQCTAREWGNWGFELETSQSCIRNCSAIDGNANDDGGFDLNGDANVLAQCNVRNSRKGIFVHDTGGDCDANVITNNQITDVMSSGLLMTGFGHGNSARGNHVKNSGSIGINVALDNSVIAANSVSNTDGPGIYVEGTKCTIEDNKVKNAATKGFYVGSASDGSSVVGNSVKGSAGVGFELKGSPLTFVKNKAKNCAGGQVSIGAGALILAFENGFAVN